MTISELILRLSNLREEIGDCPVSAAALGMGTEFIVVDVLPGQPERSDTAHRATLPLRAVLALSLE